MCSQALSASNLAWWVLRHMIHYRVATKGLNRAHVLHQVISWFEKQHMRSQEKILLINMFFY